MCIFSFSDILFLCFCCLFFLASVKVCLQACALFFHVLFPLQLLYNHFPLYEDGEIAEMQEVKKQKNFKTKAIKLLQIKTKHLYMFIAASKYRP